MNIIIEELGSDGGVAPVVIQIEEVRGLQGIPGKSQYQSYLDTTTDNPPLSEQDWSDNQFMVIETNW